MFSLTSMPLESSVFSTYTTIAALAMLLRSLINELRAIAGQFIPQQLQEKIISKVGGLLKSLSSEMTLIIDEYNGLSINEVYQASEVYFSTRITSTNECLKVSKSLLDKNLNVTINKGEQIIDVFDGIKFRWEFISAKIQTSYYDYESFSNKAETSEIKSNRLSFLKNYKEKALNCYLPHVIDRSKAIEEENKVVKLYSLGNFNGDYNGGPWGSVNLDHPSTFDTLAMDPKLKNQLLDDLDRFMKRREFYRKVGKAWKRGYLLHGPPGTGKSSLIAAMANYLKFDIYDF
ncbi:AAA-ATPase [Quillaja saponaria]|uniref:AAA-ATPase n=1 Tax=Quillaja saponaria TaxID=32244 RepID=A0AAD7KTP4_QUISA|nr:AAA-ATPase [Quillaja saponaria]